MNCKGNRRKYEKSRFLPAATMKFPQILHTFKVSVGTYFKTKSGYGRGPMDFLSVNFDLSRQIDQDFLHLKIFVRFQK